MDFIIAGSGVQSRWLTSSRIGAGRQSGMTAFRTSLDPIRSKPNAVVRTDLLS
jgi:hypothetical protein